MDMTYQRYQGGRSNPYFPNETDISKEEEDIMRTFYGDSGYSSSKNGSKNSSSSNRNSRNNSLPDHKRLAMDPLPNDRPSKNAFFSGEGPSYRGDGKDTQFGKNRRPFLERRPFSTSMPFTIDHDLVGEELSAEMKTIFAKTNPEVSGEGLYMDFIYRSWLQTPERPLSKVHRSHGLREMLQCGDVDQISAEVFHFLCGIHQCKYGDGYMRDDMVLCDCDGKVPRCFATAYIELARKVQHLEQKLERLKVRASSRTRSSKPRPSQHLPKAVTMETISEAEAREVNLW